MPQLKNLCMLQSRKEASILMSDAQNKFQLLLYCLKTQPPKKPKRTYLPLSLSFDDLQRRTSKHRRIVDGVKTTLNKQNMAFSAYDLAKIPFIDAEPPTTSSIERPFRWRHKRFSLNERPKTVYSLNMDLLQAPAPSTKSPRHRSVPEIRKDLLISVSKAFFQKI
uniref:Uncharacterized protein n=1 Tax=Syphacia muris TaxID=451379 RepID=A0A0N5AEK3_9BILA